MFNHIASWERVSGDAGVAEAAGETHLLYEEYAGGERCQPFLREGCGSEGLLTCRHSFPQHLVYGSRVWIDTYAGVPGG